MPQISLYVKENDYRKIASSARDAGKSISSFVIGTVMMQIEPGYSEEFKSLFGSIPDGDLERPDQLSFSDDCKRETL